MLNLLPVGFGSLPLSPSASGGLAYGISRYNGQHATPQVMAVENVSAHEQEPRGAGVSVEVIHPKKGSLERLSTQPGSIQPYESVRLFAKVPGFLKKQNVDINDRVKKGEVLAVVDVPELESQLKRNKAGVSRRKLASIR